MARTHIPVLLQETIDALALTQESTVIDATLGSGGHARAILELLGPEGHFLGIDADRMAIEHFALPENTRARVTLAVGNFRNIDTLAHEQGITTADAIVADLGWRMEQFGPRDDAGGGRGFSFTEDSPLHMTYGDPASYPFTAEDIVNEWNEADIANVLKGYGEERYARRIAEAIVGRREVAPIQTAHELAEIVSSAVPGHYRRSRIHPATKTFQALRIAVNDELDALSECIEGAVSLLAPSGRLAVITFHSIEDRIVKRMFRDYESTGTARRISKKPITASSEELTANPRARSAQLRILEKL